MKLIIEDDEGRRTVIPVLRDEITIGRHDEAMVKLTEKNVSRKHGRLVRDDGRFYIEDTKSFTGIRVNGEKVKGKRLVKEGDLIQISEYDLSLQAGPEEKPAAGGGGGGLGDEDDEATVVKAGEASAAAQAQQLADAKAHQEAEAEAHARAETARAEQAAQAAADLDAETKARKQAVTAVIRLSDLPASPEGDAAAMDVPDAERPKLVGLAGAYRGKELVLDRTPIRLGRSEENDLEIDHPSISRKHCRLHRDAGAWKVMDAESRNGVRVNGEPYAAVGLGHGDVLEIGHLKFAFVAPGQQFKLPTEGAAKAASARGLGLYVGLGAGLLAILLGAVYMVTRHRGTSGEESAEGSQDSKAERKFALRAADEALAAHRYTEALRSLDAARRSGATAAELRNYAVVQSEARSEDLYREMESAAAAGEFERARKLLSVLTSSTTHFGTKAGERAEAITAGYVNLHIAAAGLMKGKDNAGCLSEAQLALAANPQSADAQSLVDACKSTSAQAAPSSAAPAAHGAQAAPRPDRTAAPAPQVAEASLGARPDTDSEARKLVNDGNQKLVGQDFAAAVALYQKALSLKPSDAVLSGVYRSMGISFTRQGNIEEGAHYYKLYLPLCQNPGEKAQLQKVLDDYEARRR